MKWKFIKRSSTILTLFTILWIVVTSFSETANQDDAVAIPEIVTDYVLIYKPQPDIYTGRDTRNYKHGEIYSIWQCNDHTFTQGPNGRWHCFGIIGAKEVIYDRTHEGGVGTFHALAPYGTLEEAFRPESWVDQPKIGTGGAPYIIKIGDTYNLNYSSKRNLISTDLYNWKDAGLLKIKEEEGKDNRDPNVLYWNGTYYMTNCNDNTVNLVTSTDFVNWTDPVDICKAPVESWICESPSLIRYNDKFYLFWCLWDNSATRDQLPALYKGHTPWSYDYRTFVYVSDTPDDFCDREPITMIKGHAPEIIQDEKGNWFISSADYPQRGINLARLEWKFSQKD